jgi:probable HAF family extracellular repeat protein
MDSSAANAVSADGSVVVGYGTRGTSIESREAFRWTSGGGMVGLGYLPGSSSNGWAHGVSGDGSVVVGDSGHDSFRWTSGGGMVGLGSFGLAGIGVSADGSVIVGVGGSLSHTGSEAVRWTSDGGTVGLGLLPGDAVDSAAFGVSADGSVVVGWGRRFQGEGFQPKLEAFRWTSDTGMVGLGDLTGNLFESFAFDVSGDGSVVVGYGSTYFGTEAFLWTSDGGMKRLWDVLLDQGVNPAANGWSYLEVASGISADGNTIVGWGRHNGNTEAFVAVIPTIVPEPTAGAIALLSVNSILLLRRRSLWRPNDFSLSKDEPRD